MRGGDVQACPGQRDALGADGGLRAGPLAGPQRRVDQAGDGRAGGPRRGGRAGRGLDLGDDLVLTDGHRVQPACDREQVLGGRAADPDPGRRQHLAGRDPSAGAQQARHRANHRPGRPAGWPGHRRVDLHPVAGRQDHHLVDSRHRVQPGQYLAQLPGRHGELLQHPGRNGPVRHAQAHNRHRDDRPVSGFSHPGPG